MNNQRNNNNNNRRRGRGNNRGGNGGSQANRVDSRARGNAPQMLEKYRKLAQEAQLNDDRVQTEYYLQFADHYFRVIADGRAQKDDSRPQRSDQNGFDGDDYEDDRDDLRDDNRGRQQPQQARRNDASDEDEDGDARSDQRADRSERAEPRADKRSDGRSGKRPDNRSDNRPDNRTDRPSDTRSDERPQAQFEARPGSEGDEDDGDNPFSGKAPRKRARRKPLDDDGEIGLNPALLPPSIARGNPDPVDVDDDGHDDAPAPVRAPAASLRDEAPADGADRPRRRLKIPRSRSGDEEELETVG